MKSRLLFLLIIVTLLSSLLVSPSQTRAAPPALPVAAAPTAPTDIPVSLLSNVADYALTPPKFFWRETQTINCDPDSQNHVMRDLIKRRAIQGSTIRTVYDRTFASSPCSSRFTSNLVADSSHIYWTTSGGLLRLSTLANADVNPPTAPTTVTTTLAGAPELIMASSSVYVLTTSNGIWKVTKATNQAVRIVTAANVGANPRNFQTDGVYLYWVTGGVLKRSELSGGASQQIGGSGVTGYFPKFYLCIFPPCPPADGGVYIGVGKTLKRYNVSTGAFIADLYTSIESTARIREISVVAGTAFFVEDRQTGPADPFPPVGSFILRKKTDGSGTTPLLYSSSSTIVEGPVQEFATYNGYIYWNEDGELLRISQNASALPLTNMSITSIEATQSIQDLANSVRLIRGKRTVVRVHAKSAGPSVPGVTMLLYRLSGAGTVIGEPLQPSNVTGQYLTVQSAPNRTLLEDTFWYELPIEWTQGVAFNSGFALRLRAELNPYHFPPQASYAGNSASFSKQLSPSPTLDLRFVLFRYDYATASGTALAEARYKEDYLQALSWMRRVYPLSSKPGTIASGGTGLHTHYFSYKDNDLRRHLNYSHDDCPDDPKDDGGLCASDYVHDLLEEWDDEGNWTHAPMYGFMPEYTDINGKTWFPRGSADGDTANGPANYGAAGWDNDGASSDYYAGHEIGHVLDRDHPTPAGDPDTGDDTSVGCGHSQSDDSYPYSGARIGNGTLMGFDVGDPGVHPSLVPRVFPNSIWTDMMSYCANEWISDYTYEGIYDEVSLLKPAQDQQRDQASAPRVAVVRIAGSIYPNKASGAITRVRRMDAVASTSNPAGTHRLRLLDSNNALLATHIFTPTQNDDGVSRLRFSEYIPWSNGTRSIVLENAAGTQTYATYAVSAAPPTISNVHLVGATAPVTGNVTLAWDASDPDGDTLTFDIAYSKDNGVTFEPVELNVAANSAVVDTLILGGGATAILRVTASDGAQTASAASPPFALASKAPQVTILSPASGARVAYGQTVNFAAQVDDLQAGSLPDASLTWRNQYGQIGTGPQFSAVDLPVGINTITLTAVNGALQTTSVITVEVHDDLDLPGATLTAGPDQIGWQFDLGAAQSQSATVYVSNVGSGTLSWSASESVPWLSLNVTAGSAPDQITLTAN
ncbi:MAG: hypothetical protein H0T53_15520, partial [Herpetosiphonaceae bacterium]|nr:hypothetical protein [Herpetosiphonaceae bacterium]